MSAPIVSGSHCACTPDPIWALRKTRERRMQDKTLSAPGDRVTIDVSAGVAEVTLNRPDKLNALDPAMFKAIIAAGERLSRMAGLRAVVLTGAGRGFCAGLDKETFASIAAGGAAPTLERSHEAHAWARECVPAGGLCLAHASRPRHRGDPWRRARRRLPDRARRRHPLCRAGRAAVDPGDQMGARARHERVSR